MQTLPSEPRVEVAHAQVVQRCTWLAFEFIALDIQFTTILKIVMSQTLTEKSPHELELLFDSHARLR